MAVAQRVALQLPPRRAPQDDFKKRTISRAEGGQLQAPVGPHDLLRSLVLWDLCHLSIDHFEYPAKFDRQQGPIIDIRRKLNHIAAVS